VDVVYVLEKESNSNLVVVVFLALQPILLVIFTHSDAPQSVGLLWTSDQSVAETST